ncbi:MAG TPA: hypothetical protein VFN01_00545 [Marinobacter sp.]|uniref:hypothetical protein n=1 Tax=Marinobacter sp. TaxID=50741 RepID=UPI002D804F81|nr:hypothetical protein [Marinobacter sp.]HET8799646.1 hypothetical protein [Marinobacter sp.]
MSECKQESVGVEPEGLRDGFKDVRNSAPAMPPVKPVHAQRSEMDELRQRVESQHNDLLEIHRITAWVASVKLEPHDYEETLTVRRVREMARLINLMSGWIDEYQAAADRDPDAYCVVDHQGEIGYTVMVKDDENYAPGQAPEIARHFCHEHINDAAGRGIEGAGRWVVRPLIVGVNTNRTQECGQ